MPIIVTCFKWVVDEAYVRRGASGLLDFASVDYKISDYDRNAIEEAVRLKETHQGSVIALTVGVPRCGKGVKDALSRGPDQAYFVVDPSFGDLDASQTAAILAEVIQSRIKRYHLILCGEGSSDLYAHQVGPRLAEKLEIPCVSFVQKLSIEGDRLVAERRADEALETIEVIMPALVTVLPEINAPRIPGVKDTLMASKKPVVIIKKEELSQVPEGRLQTIDFTASIMERRCERFGTEPEEITRFVRALHRRGLVE